MNQQLESQRTEITNYFLELLEREEQVKAKKSQEFFEELGAKVQSELSKVTESSTPAQLQL